MAKTIIKTFSGQLINKPVSEMSGENEIINSTVSSLKNKVIIMIDGLENQNYKGTMFEKLVNMSNENTVDGLYTKTETELLTNTDQTELTNYNKVIMTFCKPDLSSTNKNVEVMKHKVRGTQFIPMNIANDDSNLKYYLEDIFSTYAFSKKPDNLITGETTTKINTPDGEPLSQPYKPKTSSSLVSALVGTW